MSQHVNIRCHKKLLFAIGILVVLILCIWLGRDLLSHHNKTVSVQETDVASSDAMRRDVSGKHILISAQQMKQAGILIQHLGLPNTAIQATLSLQGQTQWSPESKVVLTSPVAGVVQQILVQPLATVVRNDNVLMINSPDLIQIQNDILQIHAQQQLAQQTLARERQLFAEGIIAEKRVQEAQNHIQRLNIDLSAKQRLLQFMGGNSATGLNPIVSVKSPASGQIESLFVSTGQYVDVGMVLGQLVNADLPLQLQLQASLADSQYIDVGDTVKVEGCEITGKVQKIAPTLAGNTQTQNIIVQMNTKHRCLRVQQFVKAQVQSHYPATMAAWTVPSTALTLKDGQYFVFVRNQNGFMVIPVNVVGENQQQRYIRSTSLKPEMQIATHGVERLKAVWLGFGAEQVPASNNHSTAAVD
ncbi:MULTISPECIES: efflux RND transporter periplasmic adaptor subunit [unclassified Acinetobacter]|uniref:efflux RND transporter periplasmic adaptor subunit n=1 Tax=unclassified Acinetobacter TaxID=196816 RepID=UPI0029344DDF|nr:MULTISPECIES: efflux RND transporter periplasmic adaptor subunit [unclassified Acinetobacter]WOE31515.1 efflux RND transporter periplasmic adaptor subunit [Acinetobacter sp. SAAs470]WOE39711.1 efflux RND transporter periplasmic adaptor subunit [Acinetobacter sp. SAAs474]